MWSLLANGSHCPGTTAPRTCEGRGRPSATVEAEACPAGDAQRVSADLWGPVGGCGGGRSGILSHPMSLSPSCPPSSWLSPASAASVSPVSLRCLPPQEVEEQRFYLCCSLPSAVRRSGAGAVGAHSCRAAEKGPCPLYTMPTAQASFSGAGGRTAHLFWGHNSTHKRGTGLSAPCCLPPASGERPAGSRPGARTPGCRLPSPHLHPGSFRLRAHHPVPRGPREDEAARCLVGEAGG